MANDNQGLFLSAVDVMNMTGWSEAMINDYISRRSDYMLTGNGSPEGVEPANQTRQYLDIDTTTLYVNPVVGARTGWVAI